MRSSRLLFLFAATAFCAHGSTAHAAPPVKPARAAGDLWDETRSSSLAEQGPKHRALNGCDSPKDCPAGEFNYDGDRSGDLCYCGTCPAGKWSYGERKEGAVQNKFCKTCAAGQYSGPSSVGNGPTGCKTCPQGQYSASGAESCKPLPCTPVVTGQWKYYDYFSIPPTKSTTFTYAKTSSTGTTTTIGSSTTKSVSSGFTFKGVFSSSASVSTTHSKSIATMFQTTLEKTEAKTVEYTMPVGAIWLWEMDFTCKTGKTTTGKTTYTMPIEQAAIAPNEGSVPCCLPGCFQNLRDLTKGCVTTGLCENAPNVCQSDDTTAVTNMGHRDHADKGSRVSAGAVAGGASALVALVAVGAAIRVRHRRAQQASDHASPGTSAADDDAVPAVSGPANAL